MYVCAPDACLMPLDFRRGHSIWELNTESPRQASSALNQKHFFHRFYACNAPGPYNNLDGSQTPFIQSKPGLAVS